MFEVGQCVRCLVDFNSERTSLRNYFMNPKRGDVGFVVVDFQSPNGVRIVTLDWLVHKTERGWRPKKLPIEWNQKVHDWTFYDGIAETCLEVWNGRE